MDPVKIVGIVSGCTMFALMIAVIVAVTIQLVDKKKKKKKKLRETEEKNRFVASMEEIRMKIDQFECQTLRPNVRLDEMTRNDKAMNFGQLQEWCNRHIERVQSLELDQTMIEFEETNKKLEKTASFDTSVDARYKNIPTRKDTQIVVEKWNSRTTINSMNDYYGNKILICQAPNGNRITEHYATLFQENVGVIVWLGPLKDEFGTERIFSYVPLAKNQSGTFQKIKVVTSTNVNFGENECDTYRIDVIETKNRQMTLIHIPRWPSDFVLTNPEDLIKAIKQVSDEQTNQSSQGLPSIVVHCSTGCEESIAFVTAYIGRQMFLHREKTNPMAILQYVRSKRYLAMSSQISTPKRINIQMAVVGCLFQAMIRDVNKGRGAVISTSSIRIEKETQPVGVVV